MTSLQQDSLQQDITLSVSGMTCASCAGHVEKALVQTPEVVEATVNLPLEKAWVKLRRGADPVVAIEAIKRAGYDATVRSSSSHEHQEQGQRQGHGEHMAASVGALRVRLIVAIALGIPVMVLSMVPLEFPGRFWVVTALSLPVVIWCAWPFHKSAALALRTGATSMNTLISVGVTAATVYSLVTMGNAAASGNWVYLPQGTHIWFESATAITIFLLAGRLIEHRATKRATSALEELLNLNPPRARLIETEATGRGAAYRDIALDDLRKGDRFLVRPGEQIATDGIVEEGHSSVDESMLTGESVPVNVEPGSTVTGSTINTSGSLVVRATRVGSETAYAAMTELLDKAQHDKPHAQQLADKVSAIFVPSILVISIMTFLLWGIMAGDWVTGLHAAITVVIIACPCALGLATPTALAVSAGRASRLGMVLSGASTMETASRADTVVVDKTGTVTTGNMRVRQSHVHEDNARLVAAAASNSEHPVSRAIADFFGTGHAETVEDFENVAGGGVRARVNGHEVLLGSPQFLRENGVTSGHDEDNGHDEEDGATTLVATAVDNQFTGYITVADRVKDSSAEAIAQLKKHSFEIVLVTGDREAVAASVAETLGIDRVYSGVNPSGKVEVVKALQADGHRVIMVGDGINDAAALACADTSMAMGSGASVALAAADITLMHNDLRQVAQAVRLSQSTLRTIRQNLGWACVYNFAAVPLAALGILHPMVAGAAMAASSICVVVNSLRLLRFR